MGWCQIFVFGWVCCDLACVFKLHILLLKPDIIIIITKSKLFMIIGLDDTILCNLTSHVLPSYFLNMIQLRYLSQRRTSSPDSRESNNCILNFHLGRYIAFTCVYVCIIVPHSSH